MPIDEGPLPLEHRKIVVERSALGTRLFADWYRFGAPGAAPLVHYVGGAISDAEYERRFMTEPLPILAEFRRALVGSAASWVDLLVSSSPREQPDRYQSAAEDFLAHLSLELLPQTPNPTPGALAFVGYSYGAHLATYLALACPGTRALATLGGVGIGEAAEMAPLEADRPLLTMMFANDDDPLTWDSADLERTLPPGTLAVTTEHRAGGHEFGEYAGNASFEDAFRFVLSRLA